MTYVLSPIQVTREGATRLLSTSAYSPDLSALHRHSEETRSDVNLPASHKSANPEFARGLFSNSAAGC